MNNSGTASGSRMTTTPWSTIHRKRVKTINPSTQPTGDPEYDEAVKRWDKHFNNPVKDVILGNSGGAKVEGTSFITINSATYSALSFTVSQYGNYAHVSDAILKQQGFDGVDDILDAFGEI
jgi:hypothetical protein